MSGVTIRDVARRAQVSVASVSRVFNGIDIVRKETRERILEAANALGYVPHAGARSLSLARAHAIGVLLPDLHGEFFSECVRGMDREARARGYLLLLSTLHDEVDQAAEALKAMRGRVDGMLVMAPHIDHEALADALPPAIPAVLLNCRGEFGSRPSLRFDNHSGAVAMVDHLVANGYRDIVHLAGPQDNADALERAEGYAQAMRNHGLAPRVIPGRFDEESGENAAREIAAGDAPCDAIFAANDMMAIGCLHGFRTLGKRVPEDIAVAGFDDIPLARYVSLTTMRVSINELGERAVIRLIGLLSGVSDETRDVLVPTLVARDTTAGR